MRRHKSSGGTTNRPFDGRLQGDEVWNLTLVTSNSTSFQIEGEPLSGPFSCIGGRVHKVPGLAVSIGCTFWCHSFMWWRITPIARHLYTEKLGQCKVTKKQRMNYMDSMMVISSSPCETISKSSQSTCRNWASKTASGRRRLNKATHVQNLVDAIVSSAIFMTTCAQ